MGCGRNNSSSTTTNANSSDKNDRQTNNDTDIDMNENQCIVDVNKISINVGGRNNSIKIISGKRLLLRSESVNENKDGMKYEYKNKVNKIFILVVDDSLMCQKVAG